MQEEPVYERLVQKVENFIANVKPSEEKDTVQKKLDEIKDRYQEILDQSKTKNDKINQVVSLSQKYVDDSDTFKDWLKKTEDDVNALEPVTCAEDDLNRLIKQVKVSPSLFLCSFFSRLKAFDRWLNS